MITYREKGIGLHEKIAVEGLWLGQDDKGVWHADDPVAVQFIIDWFDPLTGAVVLPSWFERQMGRTFR